MKSDDDMIGSHHPVEQAPNTMTDRSDRRTCATSYLAEVAAHRRALGTMKLGHVLSALALA